jgi:hypothetical protein
MVYYQGRIWYAQGRIYTAGDIVGGPSGTLANQFKDSILKVTENPLALGGDGFAVPSTAGDIRALSYSANLDTSLGQGPLYIFTRRQVYQLSVPVTRADWIAATSNNAAFADDCPEKIWDRFRPVRGGHQRRFILPEPGARHPVPVCFHPLFPAMGQRADFPEHQPRAEIQRPGAHDVRDGD